MFTLFTMCSDYEEDAGEKRILVGVGLTLRLLSVRTTVCTCLYDCLDDCLDFSVRLGS